MNFQTYNKKKSILGEVPSYQKYVDKNLKLKTGFQTRF